MTFLHRLRTRLSRSRPHPWLLLLPTAQGQPWQWLHQGLDGQRQAGSGPPPPTSLGAHAALVVPAQYCSHFHVAAPPGLKPHEWAQLLEEQLLQPADTLAVACIGRDSQRLQLVACDRQRLADWQAQAVLLGVRLERCWAQMQLLADPAPGAMSVWRREGDRCLKTGSGTQPRRWLVWPDALGELPQPWAGLLAEPVCDDWPPLPADLHRLPSLLPARRVMPAWRRALDLQPVQRRLATSCVLLLLGWQGVLVVQQWQQGAAAQRQVQAQLGDVSNVTQAARRLNVRLREQADLRVRTRQQASLASEVEQWLQRHPGWQVQRSRFDGRQWQLQMSGAGGSIDSASWQAMADRSGGRVQVSPLGEGLQVNVDFAEAL